MKIYHPYSTLTVDELAKIYELHRSTVSIRAKMIRELKEIPKRRLTVQEICNFEGFPIETILLKLNSPA